MSDVRWQKSTYSSEGNNCVELGSSEHHDSLLVRESVEPGVVLTTTRARVGHLLSAVRTGKLDLP